jgi:hypothetical protein
MSEQVVGLIVVIILSAIVVLALTKKDAVETTLKFLGLEFALKAGGKPGTQKGTDEGREERQKIEAVVRQHNADFARAFGRRDPRPLWTTSTSEAYFSAVEGHYHELLASAEHSGFVAVEVRHILFQDVKLVDQDCATVRAMETWEYIYGTGQRTEREVLNLYTLKKVNGDWRIAHCDMPESRGVPG